MSGPHDVKKKSSRPIRTHTSKGNHESSFLFPDEHRGHLIQKIFMKASATLGDRMRRLGARAGARRTALDALSLWRTANGKDKSAFIRPRIYFPYLHEVPEHEEPQFRNFLKLLSVDHTFISYGDAIHRVINGPIDKPYVAFSFDDGFASNVRASQILEEFGATACFFVPPAFIDSRLPTVEAMRQFGFADGTREPAMTWTDLEEILSRGHEVGNHTMNHKTLSLVSEQEAVDEISNGAERIRQVLGECRHFAWPRGQFKHFTEAAARTVFETGHESCASAVRGSHDMPLEGSGRSLCVRRDHIMTAWPLRHDRYFVGRASENGAGASSFWPDDWKVS